MLFSIDFMGYFQQAAACRQALILASPAGREYAIHRKEAAFFSMGHFIL
jgi:hypothetical protein